MPGVFRGWSEAAVSFSCGGFVWSGKRINFLERAVIGGGGGGVLSLSFEDSLLVKPGAVSGIDGMWFSGSVGIFVVVSSKMAGVFNLEEYFIEYQVIDGTEMSRMRPAAMKVYFVR